MSRVGSLSLAAFFTLSIVCGFSAQSSNYDQYLTIADIQKVTGLTGVKAVPREPQKGAGGHLNFANANGELILLASFLTATDYNSYKTAEGMVKAPVQGVGDEAFIGPAFSEVQYMLVIRKGDKCVALSTFMKPVDTSTTQLSMEQVVAIGKIVVERI